MWQTAWTIIKEAMLGFGRHDAMTKAAALALYTALGLAPVVLLLLAVTSWLGPTTQQTIVDEVEGMVGNEAGKGINEIIASTKREQEQQASGTLSAVVGLITVLISVSGIFAQLQASLNDIFVVAPKPRAAIWSWLRSRLLSTGTFLSALFLLLVSLVVTAGIAMVFGRSGPIWMVLNVVVSLLVYAALFALIFKLLPDAEIRWRDVWIGAMMTAVLFSVGKFLIGLYLGHSAVTSSYGAAGSLVALIVWVYYSAIIVLVGAEVTQAYVRRLGSGIRSDEHAVSTERPHSS